MALVVPIFPLDQGPIVTVEDLKNRNRERDSKGSVKSGKKLRKASFPLSRRPKGNFCKDDRVLKDGTPEMQRGFYKEGVICS
jgi:hypothetical protein